MAQMNGNGRKSAKMFTHLQRVAFLLGEITIFACKLIAVTLSVKKVLGQWSGVDFPKISSMLNVLHTIITESNMLNEHFSFFFFHLVFA